VKIDIEWIDFG